jgi:predicted site-specific integrase-resolvase
MLTARELGETVLRWTRHGDLPAVRLPSGALRYRPEAIEEWLAVRATSGSRLLDPTASI